MPTSLLMGRQNTRDPSHANVAVAEPVTPYAGCTPRLTQQGKRNKNYKVQDPVSRQYPRSANIRFEGFYSKL